MSDFTQLTDDDLESERKNSAHQRTMLIDKTVTDLIVWVIKIVGILLIAALIFCVGVYGAYIIRPDVIKVETVDAIKELFTHMIAVSGGYIIHLAKRNMA